MEDKTAQMRVILRARVTDIPGETLKRPYTLGDAFCNKILNRPLNPIISISGYDGMHIPQDFDSTNPLKRWFIFDLNVVETLDKEEVVNVPHYVYQVSVLEGDWTFVRRDSWLSVATKYCTMWCWGGRKEQESFRLLREGKALSDNSTAAH